MPPKPTEIFKNHYPAKKPQTLIKIIVFQRLKHSSTA